MARAAEFEVVAAGDELYRLLSIVQRGGLLPNAPRGGATRYEMALETGRASLALASRRAANARVGEDTARALADLLAKLRPELRRLDVDVDAALSLCRVGAAAESQAPVSVLLSAAPAAPSGASGASGAGERRPGGRGAGLAASGLRRQEMNLSSRLRIEAAQSSRERSLGDPFGGEVGSGPAFFGAGASNRAGAAFFDRPQAGPHNVYGAAGVSLGASLSVSDSLMLRAGFGSSAPARSSASLRALGGTQDTDWLSAGGPRYTSAELGARVSAFNDRLGMSVNWARLMPEERDRVNQSIASFGVGLGPDRFKLQLQYQQLFGPSSSQPNRVIAGGVNISF